jgi:hypothetical protein
MAGQERSRMDFEETKTNCIADQASSSAYPAPQATRGDQPVYQLELEGQERSRKRGREGVGEGEVEKRGCEEGMSWWTCLMLGMNQENTKPQVVRKVHTTSTQRH